MLGKDVRILEGREGEERRREDWRKEMEEKTRIKISGR